MSEGVSERDTIKQIINSHVRECFRLSGYKGLPVLLHPGPTADAILATLRASGEVREAESLTYAVQHNPNCPSPYLVRLPRGVIDFAPPHQTSDALGYGKTFAEAFHAARAALAPAVGGE